MSSRGKATRSRGGLRTNSFVRLWKRSLVGRPALDIRELGDAEELLNNRRLLEENAGELLKTWSHSDGRWMGRVAWEISGRSCIRGERDRP